ncbi:MAG TPA: hypothetical protein VE338_06085 [Ktedonobacterales bacterium]|jgi:hypothetical protein|nr:hypothetical protein [Ktedonobacterales bacterium]
MAYGIYRCGRHEARRPLARLALAALTVALALVGCAPAATSGGRTTAATPAPTATSAPKTLYQADWTSRASEWTLPPHWSVVNGALENDGDSSSVIALTIPYVVTAQNYTLSMQIRAIAANGPGVSNMYGLVGQTPSSKLLYTAELTEVEHTLHSYAVVYPANPDTSNNNNFGTYDFTPGRQTRPYQVQVDGQYVSFLAGGSLVGTPVKSADQLAPARLIFLDQNVQLVIESLTITTP